MTKYGETYNYSAADYLKDLAKYMNLARLDYVVINNDLDFSRELLDRYARDNTIPVVDDLDKFDLPKNIRVIREPLVSKEEVKTEAGEVIRRSMIRHDTERLSRLLTQIIAGRKWEKEIPETQPDIDVGSEKFFSVPKVWQNWEKIRVENSGLFKIG